MAEVGTRSAHGSGPRRTATARPDALANGALSDALGDPLHRAVGAPIQALAGPGGLGSLPAADVSDSGGSALPEGVRTKMEAAHGADFGSVRVHLDDAAPKLGAEAFTQGDHVHMPPSRYSPDTPTGQEVLGHELTHVVQQRQGQVQPTVQAGGVSVNDDAGLEAHADRMGKLSAEGHVSEPSTSVPTSAPAGPMQFKGWKVGVFLEKLQKLGLAGVCDALSAAWLSDMVEPDTDDTMGIDDANIQKITLLKEMFLEIGVETDLNSKELTTAFVAWAKARGMDSRWFESLTSGNYKVRASDFVKFMEKELDWKKVEKNTKIADIEDVYAKLDVPSIYTLADDLLEPFFDMRIPFSGLVIINAGFTDEFGSLNHQFAVKYEPEGYTFSIFDQNGGLSRSGIHEQEQIAEIIADYVHKGYVANPMRTEEKVTDQAKIQLWLTPGG